MQARSLRVAWPAYTEPLKSSSREPSLLPILQSVIIFALSYSRFTNNDAAAVQMKNLYGSLLMLVLVNRSERKNENDELSRDRWIHRGHCGSCPPDAGILVGMHLIVSVKNMTTGIN